uniref:Methyltransferase, FkbM family n=1 Tax=Candidatus Kentrum sp. LFY TaxID=2126342 RepID=A0A450U8U6_9GAMM|nr:MAG: methyltransferase, FkbM family [Candidatus Kentron sp. LFY]
MSQNVQTVETLYGNKITIFENDFIGEIIIKRGIYEKEVLEITRKLLGSIPSPIVLDVGANIGNHSLALSAKAHLVLAFEPVPEIYGLLVKNIAQNNIHNIQAYNYALSDSNGSAVIFVTKNNNLGGSSLEERGDNVKPVNTVKRIGDELLAELNISKVDLIKIDVEGHELFVLEGLSKAIRKQKPYIIMEWEDPESIERLNNSDFMQKLFSEYHVYVLSTNFNINYWKSKSFPKIRRKLARIFLPRKPRIYPFERKMRGNLLFVPNRVKRRSLETLLYHS